MADCVVKIAKVRCLSIKCSRGRAVCCILLYGGDVAKGGGHSWVAMHTVGLIY